MSGTLNHDALELYHHNYYNQLFMFVGGGCDVEKTKSHGARQQYCSLMHIYLQIL